MQTWRGGDGCEENTQYPIANEWKIVTHATHRECYFFFYRTCCSHHVLIDNGKNDDDDENIQQQRKSKKWWKNRPVNRIEILISNRTRITESIRFISIRIWPIVFCVCCVIWLLLNNLCVRLVFEPSSRLWCESLGMLCFQKANHRTLKKMWIVNDGKNPNPVNVANSVATKYADFYACKMPNSKKYIAFMCAPCRLA